MKLWLVSFDEGTSWKDSILVAEVAGCSCESDVLDEAADSKEGQYDVLSPLAVQERIKEGREESIIYLGNHGDPFNANSIHMRKVTPEEVLELGMKLEPVNMDAEDVVDALIEENGNEVLKAAWELMQRSGSWTKREYLFEKEQRIQAQIKRMLETWPSYEPEEGKEKWIQTLT